MSASPEMSPVNTKPPSALSYKVPAFLIFITFIIMAFLGAIFSLVAVRPVLFFASAVVCALSYLFLRLSRAHNAKFLQLFAAEVLWRFSLFSFVSTGVIAFIRSFKAISFQIASLFGQDALDSWRSRFTVTDWEQERAFMFGDFDVPLFFGISGFLMLLALAVFVPFFVIYSTQAKLADVPESVKKSWKDTGQVFVALAGVIVFLLSAWTMFRVVSDRFPDEWQTPLVAQYEKQTLNKIY